ncbi:glycosyl transferase [Cellulomonas chitinilytica]|uniref:Glycosyl transferase n=1 Tax=Cellulomonas chitinilytica TaxID=398759 RepID=A0A919P118_9CELL|nr:glycosyltransferase family A protein [Cellulomonas chitinilytica]GIG20177.1 glycosyl transferase [Cellulomonas chitinilytica]
MTHDPAGTADPSTAATPGADESVLPGLSVVIPSYNSAQWLPATLSALDTAIVAAGLTAVEIVVVDDGSTDETTAVLAGLAEQLSTRLTVVRTENQGRFLARWTGVTRAAFDEIMLLDSRVLVDAGSLRHVLDVRRGGEGAGPWNAHAETATDAGLVGLFWEVPTYVFWGEYRARPRPMLITPENFDQVPKGTTCFVVSRALYIEASLASWPQEHAHLVSDDTKILRHIVRSAPIRIDPGFSVQYRPRQSVRGFLSHSFVRGTLFVSSYAGTSRLRDLILVLLAASPLVALAALVWAALAGVVGPVLLALVVLAAVAVLTPATVALRRGCPPRAVLAFLCYLPVFGVVFWAGLCRGLVVHRAAFAGRGTPDEQAAD